MISVCIPVYNFDITELICDLHSQLLACGDEFEILVADDGSFDNFKTINWQIASLKYVVYDELPQNLGRSKIRNLLANKTKFEYLLFIDCDAKVASETFIKNYLDNLSPMRVIIGGVAYDIQKPSPEYIFRWTYGHARESTNAKVRSIKPYDSFKTFNFLIPKSLFQTIQFDETFNGYGHEDTLFGYELLQKQIEVLHIENPLIHLGLETNEVFLQKTEKGLENLKRIYELKKTDENFINSIKILKYYHAFPAPIKFLIKLFYSIFKNMIIRNLLGKNPSVRFFDVYKLGYLISLKN